MIFSSVEFLLFFLPLFLAVYGLTPARMKNITLLGGSLIFYAWGEPRYLLLLMVSVLVNFYAGRHLEASPRDGEEEGDEKFHMEQYGREAWYGRSLQGREDLAGWGSGPERQDLYGGEAASDRRTQGIKRRLWLAGAVGFNVGLLVAFKTGLVPGGLPLGISFYTFQSLSYLFDVYKGMRAETSFGIFATYLAMFPQLISGPLVRYRDLQGTLRSREFRGRGLQEGLKVFTMGLAFKVLLADRIGLLWQEVQVTGFESISTPLAWLGAAAFSLKIYFDFYGYSLMAMGVGRMLGFKLPENFRSPYMACTVREFYQRWHMTLGGWFREYVYIPLGGNRRGEFRTVCNLLAVWLLTAVWHGSTANFLIWGMLLWLFIVMERQLEALGAADFLKRVPGKLLSRLYLWTVIPVTWMCFDIKEVEELQIYLGRMFGIGAGGRVSPGDWVNALQNYRWLFLVGMISCTPVVINLFRRFRDSVPGSILLAALFWFCVWRLQVEGKNPFMYFDF